MCACACVCVWVGGWVGGCAWVGVRVCGWVGVGGWVGGRVCGCGCWCVHVCELFDLWWRSWEVCLCS